MWPRIVFARQQGVALVHGTGQAALATGDPGFFRGEFVRRTAFVAFFGRKRGFVRIKFVSRPLFVRRTTALAGDFALFFG